MLRERWRPAGATAVKAAADQMEDRLLYWVGTASLVGLLAWDDWLVRDELAQLRQERTALAALAASTPACQAAQPVQPALAPRADCPVVAPGATMQLAAPAQLPTTAVAKGVPEQETGTTVIPPGTDLAEAMRVFQREQARTPPGSVLVSPFGPSK